MARDQDERRGDAVTDDVPQDAVPRELTAEEEAVVSASAPLGQRLQRVAWLVVAVVFAIFAAVNAQSVDFNWVFGSSEVVERGGERVSGGVPLIVLLVAAFAMGAAVAWLGTWRTRRRRLREVRAARRAGG